MPQTRTVSIIGLGIMGRRMLDNMLEHPGFTVAAMWDPDAGAAAKARELAPDVPVAASARAAIEAAEALYVACPPVPRAGYAIEAAGLGRGVFLEKPLGVDAKTSHDLVAALEATGVPAAVNFTQAASPALSEVTRAAAAGEMGDLKGVDIVVTYPAWPRAWQVEADWLRFRAEGGYTREVISHFLFFSARVVGPLRPVWSKPTYPADPALCETHIQARLETEAGVPVSVFGSVGGVQPDRQELTVTGGALSYRVTDFYRLWSSRGDAFEEALTYPGDPRRDALQHQLTEFARCLAGEPHKLATPAEALAVQANIEAMLV